MIKLSPDALPDDAHARHEALRNYLCDKDAHAERTGDGWTLSLHWPDGIERHVDPALPEGLARWGSISRGEMALAHYRQGRVLRALYDTWTLHSWSEWLARTRRDATAAPVILHVDDHQDLGSPRLAIDSGAWRDLITGAAVDLFDPKSVRAAIESGAIGMGSFLTPFLHVFPNAEVRHLCQPPRQKKRCDYRVRLTTEPDTLLAPGRERPAIELDEIEDATGPGTYRATADIGDWIADIGAGPVLVHIDMDYFNNRYDGDSDWIERPTRLDPSWDHICGKIRELTSALSSPGVIDRVEDLAIAYSPGFFPAEFWREADAELVRGLKPLYEH